MHIINNFPSIYEVKEITNNSLTITKKHIINIAERILKYSPFIIGVIQTGIIFSLPSAEGAVLRDEATTLRTTLELDQVITVPLIDPIPTRHSLIMCALSVSYC